ncbi:MAG TPA: 4Fe-4S dicluster domain-containing protein [Planctomycetota bacterium]|nr:4Fe-4S dicluster domain-containing protein [Planctomycetota bacterium]
MATRDEILEAARSAGVVGADDGMPTHVKLMQTADIVIVNGCDCEPLVYNASHLLVHHAAEVIDGLRLAMQACGAARGVMAFLAESPAVDSAVGAAIAEPGIEIFHAPPFYPVGDECILTYEVTGRLVPSFATPASIGVLVLNVETLFNLSQAMRGTPVTQRTVTVSGDVVLPRVVRLPLGVRASDAIALAGGPAIERYRVLMGGPMLGSLADDTCEPITKNTTAIVVLSVHHIQVQKRTRSLSMMLLRARNACFQCRECTDSCPRYLAGQQLEPHTVMRAISYSMDSLNKSITLALNCNGCGVCDSYVCRMGISPRLICHEIKAHLAAMGWQRTGDVPPPVIRESYAERRVWLEDLASRLGVTKYVQAIDLRSLLDAPADAAPVCVHSVAVPLLQHVGSPALAAVGVGQTVVAGQLIGEIPEGKLGARIHAGVGGTVGSVCDCSIEINGVPDLVADAAGS